MTRAQVVHELGPPSAMIWQQWDVPDPGPGEVRLRHTAIGVNFADTYHRGGVPHPWPVPPCPVVIGFEGVGLVEGVGEGVTGFGPGDRVAYGIPPLGSSASAHLSQIGDIVQMPRSCSRVVEWVVTSTCLPVLRCIRAMIGATRETRAS